MPKLRPHIEPVKRGSALKRVPANTYGNLADVASGVGKIASALDTAYAKRRPSRPKNFSREGEAKLKVYNKRLAGMNDAAKYSKTPQQHWNDLTVDEVRKYLPGWDAKLDGAANYHVSRNIPLGTKAIWRKEFMARSAMNPNVELGGDGLFRVKDFGEYVQGIMGGKRKSLADAGAELTADQWGAVANKIANKAIVNPMVRRSRGQRESLVVSAQRVYGLTDTQAGELRDKINVEMLNYRQRMWRSQTLSDNWKERDAQVKTAGSMERYFLTNEADAMTKKAVGSIVNNPGSYSLDEGQAKIRRTLNTAGYGQQPYRVEQMVNRFIDNRARHLSEVMTPWSPPASNMLVSAMSGKESSPLRPSEEPETIAGWDWLDTHMMKTDPEYRRLSAREKAGYLKGKFNNSVGRLFDLHPYQVDEIARDLARPMVKRNEGGGELSTVDQMGPMPSGAGGFRELLERGLRNDFDGFRGQLERYRKATGRVSQAQSAMKITTGGQFDEKAELEAQEAIKAENKGWIERVKGWFGGGGKKESKGETKPKKSKENPFGG